MMNIPRRANATGFRRLVFAVLVLGGLVWLPTTSRAAADLLDGSNTVAWVCSQCHGEIPPPAAVSLALLTDFANGGPHGGGPTPYQGVNLTNLAAYIAHRYHEENPTQTYAIYGVVTDAAGHGLGNVRVRATSDYLTLPDDLATNTSAEGAFMLAGLPAGDIQLIAEAGGYAFQPVVNLVNYRALVLPNPVEWEFWGRPAEAPPLDLAAVIPAPQHVRPDGDDRLGGKSWFTAKRTVQAALDAVAPGGRVWVAEGLYREQVSVMGRELYGGFAGRERNAAERQPGRNPTVLDGTPATNQPAASVVFLGDQGTNHGRLDGLVIQNGQALWPNDVGGGVCVAAGAAPAIVNCVLRRNQADYGGAIGCLAGATPSILQNRLEGNYGGEGGGIFAGLDSTPALVANNLLAGNISDAGGAAIHCEAGVTRLVNNTIVGNLGLTPDAGVLLYLLGTGVTANNLVAFNSAGVEDDLAGATRRNNCVFGNTNGNYVNCNAGAADLAADPRLENPGLGNYQLRPDSPCVDAGDADAAAALAADAEGRPRAARLRVDIGAYELPPPTLQLQALPNLLALSWPVAEGGFVLEFKAVLNDPWQPVLPAAATNEGLRQVFLPRPDAAAFFRLRK